ncbi:hypothetical protein ACUOFC_56240, partial [Escherichia sp. TWPC-MK]
VGKARHRILLRPNLIDYSKEQVITDILDQYERHLNFIHLHREAPGHSVMFPDA